MKWGNKDQVETWKAIILDMNEHQLKMAFMMILCGQDIEYALDHARSIYNELTKAA